MSELLDKVDFQGNYAQIGVDAGDCDTKPSSIDLQRHLVYAADSRTVKSAHYGLAIFNGDDDCSFYFSREQLRSFGETLIRLAAEPIPERVER